MTATPKTKVTPPFPRAKITRAVESIIPNGNFKLQVTDSLIEKMKIVRVITPAWKALRPAQRIVKVLDAVSGKLTDDEERGILRFSVLTPEEYKRVAKNSPVSFRKGAPHGARKGVAKAKRVVRTRA